MFTKLKTIKQFSLLKMCQCCEESSKYSKTNFFNLSLLYSNQTIIVSIRVYIV